MFKYLLSIAMLILTGCVSQTEIIQMNSTAPPPSAKTKAAIVQAARSYLKDPYSIRDAEISSEVMLDRRTNTTSVCVRYNSKNGFGAYAGRSTTAVRLINSVPVAAYEAQPACNHPALRYYPFPEVKKLANL